MTDHNEGDPIQYIARQLGIETFGDGLLVKIRESIDLLKTAAHNCQQYRDYMAELAAQGFDFKKPSLLRDCNVRYSNSSEAARGQADLCRHGCDSACPQCYIEQQAAPAQQSKLAAQHKDFDALAARLHEQYPQQMVAAGEWAEGFKAGLKVGDLPLYTCTGKGGEYAKLGYAKPAGAIKAIQGDSGLIIYRDTATGQLYFRDPGDFRDRMAPLSLLEPSTLGGDEVRQRTTADQFRELAKANAAQLGEALALIERYRTALDHIGGLSRALRVGGPDPMDLQGLSDALEDAVDTANGALS